MAWFGDLAIVFRVNGFANPYYELILYSVSLKEFESADVFILYLAQTRYGTMMDSTVRCPVKMQLML
jgi:hypothetical protein